jgi:hypothetical protein
MTFVNIQTAKKLMQRVRDEHGLVCDEIAETTKEMLVLQADIEVARATNDDRVIELLGEKTGVEWFLTDCQLNCLKWEKLIGHLAFLIEVLEEDDAIAEAQEVTEHLNKLLAASGLSLEEKAAA